MIDPMAVWKDLRANDDRIADALLLAVLQRLQSDQSLSLYQRGVICPTEAANQMLDDIGPRVFFGTTTPEVIDE